MTKAPALNDVSNVLNAAVPINENWDAIQVAFENTLSLDGSTPNAMGADLDMNSNDILNAGVVNATALKVAGTTFIPASAVAISTPDWEGAWETLTAYEVNDLVSQNGNTYICVIAHTSGTFSTDLAANRWELFASKGDSGAGTGDLLSSNNLSDLANTDTALANLGGGTTGIALFKDTTPANARTELGLGSAALATLIDADDFGGATASNVNSAEATKAYIDGRLSAYEDGPNNLSSTTGLTFTGIPTGINRIQVIGRGISHNSNLTTGDLLIRIGGASLVTSGYNSLSGTYLVSRSSTAGFIILNPGAASSVSFVLDLVRSVGTNIWTAHGHGKVTSSITVIDTWSDPLAISGPLARVGITTVGGTATFDAGNISIRCE